MAAVDKGQRTASVVGVVGDRGMPTQARIDAISSLGGLDWVISTVARSSADATTFSVEILNLHDVEYVLLVVSPARPGPEEAAVCGRRQSRAQL